MNAAQAELSDRIGAYQSLFKSEKGQRVLGDLKYKYLFQRMGGKQHAAANNPLGITYIEAQRELMLYLIDCVECDLTERINLLEENDPNGRHGQSEPNSYTSE